MSNLIWTRNPKTASDPDGSEVSDTFLGGWTILKPFWHTTRKKGFHPRNGK
jgi:hypothetical protein